MKSLGLAIAHLLFTAFECLVWFAILSVIACYLAELAR